MSIDPALSSDFYSEGNHSRERDNTIPRFYVRPVQNNFRTQLLGRPIFDDIEYVEVVIPGNRGTVMDTPVRDEHRQRWPRQYAAFKESAAQVEHGTPLAEWGGVTRSQAEELKFFHIHTVENLAGLDDTGLQKAVAQGGFQLRERAQRFLEQAAGSEPANALAAKVDEQAAMIEQFQKERDAMMARLQALETGNAEAKA